MSEPELPSIARVRAGTPTAAQSSCRLQEIWSTWPGFQPKPLGKPITCQCCPASWVTSIPAPAIQQVVADVQLAESQPPGSSDGPPGSGTGDQVAPPSRDRRSRTGGGEEPPRRGIPGAMSQQCSGSGQLTGERTNDAPGTSCSNQVAPPSVLRQASTMEGLSWPTRPATTTQSVADGQAIETAAPATVGTCADS